MEINIKFHKGIDFEEVIDEMRELIEDTFGVEILEMEQHG